MLNGLYSEQFAFQSVVDGILHLHPVVGLQAAREIALWVEIDTKYFATEMPKAHGQSICGGCFADAALLIGNTEYFCYIDSPPSDRQF